MQTFDFDINLLPKKSTTKSVIFGDDFRLKNWLFGLCCQMNDDIMWKLGVAVGLFPFIIAESTILLL